MRPNGNYVQPQDSVERLSHAHTPHGAETQLKKVAESGSPTADANGTPGLPVENDRVWLSCHICILYSEGETAHLPSQ